jgi:TRAP-type C4-dicarboxylate transport system permease small subunit
MVLIEGETMTTVNLPKSIVYGTVCFGFVLMCLRSAQVSVENWRRGYSILERPEAFETAV